MSFRSITLGADPEFGLQNEKGRNVHPNTTGAQIVNEFNHQFGVDGCGAIMELRPTPADTPKGLVENIRSIMQQGADANPEIACWKWKGGSMCDNNAIGGHLHFGNSQLRDQSNAQTLNAALNKTLGPIFTLLEDPEEAVDRRIGVGYGSMLSESYRMQPHGMEYRVLPSWLSSPVDAEGAIALGHLLAINSGNAKIMAMVNALPEIDYDAIEDCNKTYIAFFLKGIATCLTQIPKFDEYRSSIIPIFRKIANGETLFMGDMKESWKLKIKKEEKKKEVSSSAVSSINR